MLPTTATLTTGERLCVARRRRRLTQERFARRFGLSLNKYKAVEADAEDAPSLGRRPLAVYRLKPHEACRILRVRAGLTLEQLAAKMRVTKWWLCNMERGTAPAGRLVGYWTF